MWKIIKKGFMPEDNEDIRIEDWSEDFKCKPKNSTVTCFPRSKVGIPALWCEFYPKQNESFRVQFDFDSEEEAAKCFKDITSGKKRPFDFIKNYVGTLTKENIKKCLE